MAPCTLKYALDTLNGLYRLNFLNILHNHLMELIHLIDVVTMTEPFVSPFLELMLVGSIQHFPQQCPGDKDAAADTDAGNLP